MSQSVGSSPTGTTEHILRTNDGARLATTILAPPADSVGSTVVLSHGWAAGRTVWSAVTDRLLAEGHSVVLYDQRGHGASTLGREPISIPRLGADLATVLAYLDARDVVVAGHSGGGFAAMAYATTDPHGAAMRLRGLALLATAAHRQDTSAGEVRMMGSALFSWALSRPRLGRRLLRHTLGQRADAAALEVYRAMFATTPARVRADCFRSSHGMDLRPGLRSVTVPAVVLAGEADRVTAPELGQAIAAAMPHARFEQLPNVGHMLPLEAPERVAHVIAELAHR
jgi:pimeloyl-ACP methyl ester carboxylesterase